MNNNTPEFYRFTCEAGDEPATAELLIFDAIGNWEEIGEVSAKAFSASLGALPRSVKRINLHINSPGGSLFDASAIYSRLADHPSEKHVYIDGLAASAASVVAMVGHRIYIRANATMMIHLPNGLAIGNADDMRRMAGALDTVTESMINVYQRRTRLDRNDIRNLLAAETWLSPELAVEKGFADEVRGVVKAAASLGDGKVRINDRVFDLSRFKNVPAFSATNNQPKENMNPTNAPAPTPPTPTPTPTPAPAPPQPTPTPSAPPDPGTGGPPDPGTGHEPAPGTGHPPKPGTGNEDAGEAAVAAERARVSALMALDRPATHAIITAAIKDGKQVTDVITEVMAALDNAGTQSARRADASVLNRVPPSNAGEGSGKENEFGLLVATHVTNRLKRKNAAVNGRN